MPRRQQTIRINQGYRIDSKWEALALAGRVVARTVRLGWRYRTELGLLLALALVRILAGRSLSHGHAWMFTGSTAATALLWPASRAVLLGRLSCARTRRLLLACMAETRVATSAGRLPLVLRSRVTPAGERVTFGLFPGQSAELLDARAEELRAAARARDVTVTRDRPSPGRHPGRGMVDMSARGDRRPGPGQRGIPGLEHERPWTRQPPRTTDPLNAADACPDCNGTAVDLGSPEPDGVCHSCLGTGWAP